VAAFGPCKGSSCDRQLGLFQMRILIVEDEFLIAKTLAQILTDGGHVVSGMVGSAEKAIQMLENQKIDAAVVDANLAGSSAAPIETALRKRGIPFAVISGYSKLQLLAGLQDAPFLPKPVDPVELLAVVAMMARDN
jgi:DNA-binding response OmpR family regulator